MDERRRAAGTVTARARWGVLPEDQVAVRCSCGKLVAAPRGWAYFVKHTKDVKGKCPCKYHGFKQVKRQDASPGKRG